MSAEVKQWKALGRAIMSRRVELGMHTRSVFARATGLTAKTLGEIERGERTSYDPATLLRVERALNWPEGHIQQILDDGSQESEISPGDYTLAQLLRLVGTDDLPVAMLLYSCGLAGVEVSDLLIWVRQHREHQHAELVTKLADRIRRAGGHAPDPAWPPTWLTDRL